MTDAAKSNDVDKLRELYTKAHVLLKSTHPITIPNYSSITFARAQEIVDAIDSQDFRKAESLVMAHAFDLRNRAIRLTYFYRNCSKCDDLLRLFESATLAVFQDNFIAAFFTLMPLVEGLVLRWMAYDAKSQRPSFAKIKSFVTARSVHIRQSVLQAKDSNNLHTVADFQMEHLDALVHSHLFENHLGRISNLNRHLALHLMDVPNFSNSLNTSQLLIVIDNIIDAILWDEGNYAKAWSEQFNDEHRGTRRMYEMAFQAARLSPNGYFRFARDINEQNQDYYSRWVLQYLELI
jgi:hypothetical protein